MDAGFRLEPRDGYLYVSLDPGFEMTPRNTTDVWTAICESCRELGLCKALAEGDGVVRRLTPMVTDYRTVGEFYEQLSSCLLAFAQHHGEKIAFCGDPALQLSASEVPLLGTKPVICAKTAIAAFTVIREQGEGAAEHLETSHFSRFQAIRDELTRGSEGKTREVIDTACVRMIAAHSFGFLARKRLGDRRRRDNRVLRPQPGTDPGLVDVGRHNSECEPCAL